jgi:mannose-1-phosphate guanylyltransferase
MIHTLIMAGGSGTRFWPESRRALPKQFLNVSGDRTLIQAAYDRCIEWIPAERTWVVTNHLHAAETQLQLPDLPAHHLFLEPQGKNTAPCIALAAQQILLEDPDATLVVMSADHIIATNEQFKLAVQTATQVTIAQPQSLVLFGIKPTYPAVGFGYIQRGSTITGVDSELEVFAVEAFKEKPPKDVAQAYLESGQYYWNSGIFVWKARTILDLLQQFQPAILTTLDKITAHAGGLQAGLDSYFKEMPSISIDYAVLEKASHVCVLEAPFTWDDMGSWEALARQLTADANGNYCSGHVLALESGNCVIRSTGEHVVTALGVDNLIIVHTPTATLVAQRGDENAIKRLIQQLEEKGWAKYL